MVAAKNPRDGVPPCCLVGGVGDRRHDDGGRSSEAGPGSLTGAAVRSPLNQIARNRLLPLAPAYEGIGRERVQ